MAILGSTGQGCPILPTPDRIKTYIFCLEKSRPNKLQKAGRASPDAAPAPACKQKPLRQRQPRQSQAPYRYCVFPCSSSNSTISFTSCALSLSQTNTASSVSTITTFSSPIVAISLSFAYDIQFLEPIWI